MINCRICNKEVTDEINLSDGGMMHESCMSTLHGLERGEEEKLAQFQNSKYKVERELRRRQGIGFKLLSIFINQEIETQEIEKLVSDTEKAIDKITNDLSKFRMKHLRPLYDYFLDYPPDWDERRSEVITRDGEKCSKCGFWRKLHLHHVIPLSKGGSNKTSNLILLCERHHKKEHGKRSFSNNHDKYESAFSKRVSAIRHAIELGKHVTFSYKKPGEKRYNKRTIKPFELLNIAHRSGNDATLCVSGFCELRQAPRTFALKRMKGLKVGYPT